VLVELQEQPALFSRTRPQHKITPREDQSEKYWHITEITVGAVMSVMCQSAPDENVFIYFADVRLNGNEQYIVVLSYTAVC